MIVKYVLTAAIFATMTVALPAWAQKGHGNPGNQGQGNQSHNTAIGNGNAPDARGAGQQQGATPPAAGQSQGAHSAFVVGDQDRSTVSSYYREEFARGNCPPGLAKKDNGCMPPGLAKKEWQVGQPLPSSVTYYPLPPQLYTRLSPPPPGYEYVRVNDDVLLMQTANRSVANLVVNLLR